MRSLTFFAVSFLGDFNCQHVDWGYSSSNEEGESLSDWASSLDLHLLHDAKQKGSFHSARWKRDYNPDLCWVTSGPNLPLQASHTVLEDFPHSQHRPALIKVGLQLSSIDSVKKPKIIPIEEAYKRLK